VRCVGPEGPLVSSRRRALRPAAAPSFKDLLSSQKFDRSVLSSLVSPIFFQLSGDARIGAIVRRGAAQERGAERGLEGLEFGGSFGPRRAARPPEADPSARAPARPLARVFVSVLRDDACLDYPCAAGRTSVRVRLTAHLPDVLTSTPPCPSPLTPSAPVLAQTAKMPSTFNTHVKNYGQGAFWHVW
jgi:hypothetical protein